MSMKLMFITRIFAEMGGLERIWTDKMNALSDLGYDVCLVTTDQGSHAFPYSLGEKVRHIDLGIRLTQKYSCRGFRRAYTTHRLMKQFKHSFLLLIQSEQPDVLIGNTSTFSDSIIKWRAHIPIIIESHGIFDRPYHMEAMTLFKYVKAYFHRRMIGKANLVVALTDQDAARWRTVCPNVLVIPDMVNLNHSGTYSTRTNKRVIFVGRYDAQKGYDNLIKIWNMASPSHTDWRLDIYGEGTDSESCCSMIPPGENVFLHGKAVDMITCYKESAILILTSVYEPFGLVMPEAMSCGLPVIAFDCPYGPQVIIKDGEDGFLIANNDINGFSAKLSMLMENDKLRHEMGQRAIKSALRYDCQSIIPIWQFVYSNMKVSIH